MTDQTRIETGELLTPVTNPADPEDAANAGAGSDATSEDAEPRSRLWATDTGGLTVESRRALVALVKGPYVSGRSHPQLWRAVLGDEKSLRSRLSDMFLELIVDIDSQLAFVRNAEVESIDVPAVVRTHTLTFLDTALLLHLRHELLRADRAERVIIGTDEARDALRVYGNAYGLDEVNFAKRFSSSWRKMYQYGLLAETRTEGRYEISPVLRLIFGPNEIRAVREEYERRLAEAGLGSESPPLDDEVSEDDDQDEEDEA